MQRTISRSFTIDTTEDTQDRKAASFETVRGYTVRAVQPAGRDKPTALICNYRTDEQSRETTPASSYQQTRARI